ncbi:malonyl-[acyl-carrier protein] O-methyltransferase BioC [Mixta theicola]|uniref:Malonyl-[acyl-carrier protein] O-methyltransferase n=1 Tax=Mixta theicola TaxID=1458355 RepID=A0A2K1QF78_9GAMM|nr:malonyl-ACP O-methyltransferase BioC [Mixta theicola]PNS13659.1 malonyl-[acyl-carrier protein] O-methyltransferase BioC [Mixta theicola]GLR09988.1 malonyl-[acyl-carrier protein] O-methyltransferase [Mixta theicola]
MTHKVNKQAVAQAFGRAAGGYDRFAGLQRYSGERLMALLPALSAGTVLDAGCGTGWFSRRWREQGHQVIALDLSPGMLAQARRDETAHHYLLGDIEALPLRAHSVDMSWSNLAMQWCDDLAQGLRELCRVTRPGGRVLFSTLAEASLHEVRSAWQALDDYQHVNTFLSEAAIRQAGDGLALRLSSETVEQRFPDVRSALQSLKGIGATHIHQGRASGLLTRQRLQQLAQHWPQDERGYRLSYQLVTGVIDCV